jgi:hypothetical protein
MEMSTGMYHGDSIPVMSPLRTVCSFFDALRGFSTRISRINLSTAAAEPRGTNGMQARAMRKSKLFAAQLSPPVRGVGVFVSAIMYFVDIFEV